MTTTVPEPTLGEAAYRTLLPSEATGLDEHEHGKVRCVIVTPERAVLDAVCDLVVLPMYDGELGVLAGRAPLVGQLGPGELRLKTGTNVARFFVDGGFAQVRANVVTVLTPQALARTEVTAEVARRAAEAAEGMPSANPVERTNRQKAQARARAMTRMIARAEAEAAQVQVF
jgi:F-type H+-transporting ATPase subunit epsilon